MFEVPAVVLVEEGFPCLANKNLFYSLSDLQ